MWLWDTNIVRAFSDSRADGHGRVRARTEAAGPESIALPVIVVTELLEGRLQYIRTAHRLAPHQLVVAFRQFTHTLQLLSLFSTEPFDEAALRVYQQRHLFPGSMSRADRLIAAIALAGDHRLVTRNVGHFLPVPGLRIENWIDDSPSPG
jgi:tRNA(fMet)-specific endonuclease VapC